MLCGHSRSGRWQLSHPVGDRLPAHHGLRIVLAIKWFALKSSFFSSIVLFYNDMQEVTIER